MAGNDYFWGISPKIVISRHKKIEIGQKFQLNIDLHTKWQPKSSGVDKIYLTAQPYTSPTQYVCIGHAFRPRTNYHYLVFYLLARSIDR